MQKILTHKFWILFLVALLVPVIGWWMTSGALQTEVEAKAGEIKTAEGAIPNPNGDIANPKFVTGAEEIVGKKEQVVVDQIKLLWERQQANMKWPEVMKAEMAKYKYRDPIDDSARLRYRVFYPPEVERIKDIIVPFNPNTQKGFVNIDVGQLPFVNVAAEWGSTPPPASKMWDAQEDNWFTESIFKAIAKVNAGENPKIISDAPIREIKTLMYRGGRRGELGATAASSGTTAVQESSGTEGGDGTPALNLFGKAGAGSVVGGEGGSSGATAVGQVSFEPAEVFGDDALETAGTEGNVSAAPTFLGTRSGTNRPVGRRYIDDAEDLPYKTRGFYLHVVMRNEYVPELLVALTNMDWPTYIARVHLAEVHPDPVEIVDNNPTGGGATGSTTIRPSIAAIPTLQPRTNVSAGTGPGSSSTAKLNLLDSAMKNEALVEVVIAGVITIYKEPTIPGEEAAEGETTENGESTGETTEGESTEGETTEGETPDGEPADTTPMDPTDPADPAAPKPTDGMDDGTPTDPASTDPEATDPTPADPGVTPTVDPDPTDSTDTMADPTDSPEPEGTIDPMPASN